MIHVHVSERCYLVTLYDEMVWRSELSPIPGHAVYRTTLRSLYVKTVSETL